MKPLDSSGVIAQQQLCMTGGSVPGIMKTGIWIHQVEHSIDAPDYLPTGSIEAGEFSPFIVMTWRGSDV